MIKSSVLVAGVLGALASSGLYSRPLGRWGAIEPPVRVRPKRVRRSGEAERCVSTRLRRDAKRLQDRDSAFFGNPILLRNAGLDPELYIRTDQAAHMSKAA